MIHCILFLVAMELAECVYLATTRPVVAVVSLAKSGTTSLAAYFECGGLRVSHWRCGRQMCGSCVHNNAINGRAAFVGCGSYQVFAQIDQYDADTCAKPTPEIFDSIRAHRNISVILSYRHANDWARSVLRWRDLASRMLACGTIPNTTLPAMARAYTTYVADTQAYWLQHRWHHFVFLDIESKLAGRQLQRVYGIPASCWGHFNANLRPT